MKLPIIEQFLSIQGEGDRVGELSYFIRLAGCNLKCAWCDTKYASRPSETAVQMIDIKDIVDEVRKIEDRIIRPFVIIFTGGEALIHKKEIKKCIKLLDDNNLLSRVEIETNGTILPIHQITNFFSPNSIAYNISPKLLSSKNNPKKSINIKTLRFFNNNTPCIFKFVIKTNEDWYQMKQIILDVKIKRNRVYVMPEGKTDAELKKNAKKLINKVIEGGYNFSPRLHIWLWGSKKGV